MLARKAFCPITTDCCSGVICEIVTGVALIVFFSLSAICQGVCLRPGRMGHPGRRCLRCDRGFLRYQKESLVSSRAPALFAGERDLSERFLGPTETSGLGMTIVRCRNADFPAPDVPARWVLPV